MKIIDNPPKDKKFLAVYIDGDDQQAMVCKWMVNWSHSFMKKILLTAGNGGLLSFINGLNS